MMKGWLGFVTGLLLLTACKTMDLYEMEILRPAYINHTIGEEGVLLIDNAGNQPDFMGHSLVMPNRDGGDSVVTVKVQSAQAKPLLLGYLKDRMEGLGFYPYVDVLPDSCLPERKVSSLDFAQSDPLTDNQIDSLGHQQPHRLWISMDGWQLKSVTRIGTSPQYDHALYEATRDVYSAVVWRLYDVSADTLMVAFKQTDTLYWSRIGVTIEKVLKALPTVDSTLPEIADYVVGRVLNVLTPYWQPVSRWYFIAGSYRMKYAYDAVRMDNWDKAADYWEEEFANGVGRSAYRSALNMMLYFERLEDPSNALAWSNKAAEAMQRSFSFVTERDSNLLANWRTTLQRRVEELKRLSH